MERNERPGLMLCLGVLAALLSAVLALCLGAAGLTLPQLWEGVLQPDSIPGRILFHVRLPRVLTTLLCGCALGMAGAVLQTVLHNSLAGPNIIGVNAGAGLGAVACMALAPGAAALQVSLWAFVGALAAVGCVYLVGRAAGSSRLTLVLSGVALGSLLTAGIDAITTFMPDVLASATQFKQGSAAMAAAAALPPLALAVGVGGVGVLALSRELDLLALGDETAFSLGMRPGRYRLAFLMLACLMAGGAIAVMGLVGFVGLLVPHMARLLTGSEGRRLLPLSGVLGAAFLTLCDLAARTLFAPYELPVGILLSALGAPFFLGLLIRRRGA